MRCTQGLVSSDVAPFALGDFVYLNVGDGRAGQIVGIIWRFTGVLYEVQWDIGSLEVYYAPQLMREPLGRGESEEWSAS
jgi:hypothetical protein